MMNSKEGKKSVKTNTLLARFSKIKTNLFIPLELHRQKSIAFSSVYFICGCLFHWWMFISLVGCLLINLWVNLKSRIKDCIPSGCHT